MRSGWGSAWAGTDSEPRASADAASAGLYERAIRLYRAALSVDPYDEQSRLGIVDAYVKMGRLADAEAKPDDNRRGDR